MNIKIIFFLSFLFVIPSLFPNLRAPWNINQFPSYSLTNTSNELLVKNEVLQIKCPEIYDGDGNAELIVKLKCKVTATYEIESNVSSKYNFEFISPSNLQATAIINTLEITNIQSQKYLLSEIEMNYYKISKNCRFCGDVNYDLYKYSFSGNLNLGKNIIQIEYEQPTGLYETKYGYFTNSKWSQGIGYELWPLKEWKKDSNFKIHIKFSAFNGGFFKRLFSSNIQISCNGMQLNFKKLPTLNFNKEQVTSKEELGNDSEVIKNLEPFSSISQNNEYLIYEIIFDSSFPDRLYCSYGH